MCVCVRVLELVRASKHLVYGRAARVHKCSAFHRRVKKTPAANTDSFIAPPPASPTIISEAPSGCAATSNDIDEDEWGEFTSA